LERVHGDSNPFARERDAYPREGEGLVEHATGADGTLASSLRLTIDIVLSSGFPMAVRWGSDFVLIYNDAYKAILGEKHPWALGLSSAQAWSEVWHKIEPIHRGILSGIQGAFFAEDILLRIQRYENRWEDARFTLSYSPIPDPTAPSGIGGVFRYRNGDDGAD
jgi:hypothetical protein